MNVLVKYLIQILLKKNAIKYIEFEYSKNDTRMTSILVQR